MSITSQLPPIALAQASATLRALAQAAGQTVEARVISQSGNGTTQLQVGRQVLNLTLPEAQPVGTTLTLSVQQAEGQLRLAVVATRPPSAPALGVPLAATSVASSPATSVQLSAAALSSTGLSNPVSSAAPATVSSPAATTQGAPTGPTGSAPAVAPPAAAGVRVAPGYGPPVSPAPGATPAPAAQPPGDVTPAPAGSPMSSSAPARVSFGTASQGASAMSGGAGPVGSQAASGPVISTPTTVPSAPAPVAAGTSVPASAPVQSGPLVTPPVPVVGAAPAGRMDIPYAVAAPATAPPQVSSVTGSAATALPPVAQMVPSSTVGQHAPPPNGLAAQPASATTAPVATAPPPASPQVVLAQMVQQALSRQDSIVGLTTALAAIAGKVALPEPVAKAAQQLLAMRMPLDTGPLRGASIKAAVQRSGVFQEALLVSGQGQAAAGDVKSALLGLRQSLGTWLGNQAPIAQLSAVSPPMRGQVPRARSGDGAPPELPDDPVEIGKVLVERTEAALSRLRLHQHASLPDPGAARQDGQWSLDLPVMVAGQQHLLQMQIHRDPEKEADRPEDRGWQVRFAINLAERGEVGAQISLRARTTGVLLWAEDAETAQSLGAAADSLREAIAGVGLVPGAILVRAGAPAPQAPQSASGAGHYVDAQR